MTKKRKEPEYEFGISPNSIEAQPQAPATRARMIKNRIQWNEDGRLMELWAWAGFTSSPANISNFEGYDEESED